MAELTVIRWRDIPMQVVAKGDGGTARRLLPDRFQEAVDASAMVDGLIGSDDYTAQMVMDRRGCGEDLEADARRFTVSPGGIVVIPKGAVVPAQGAVEHNPITPPPGSIRPRELRGGSISSGGLQSADGSGGAPAADSEGAH